MDNLDTNRLLAIVNRVEADIVRLSAAVEAAQRTLKNIKAELKQNGKKVVELQAGQQFLAGQFKNRDGTMYGIGRMLPPPREEE
jgi:hypothetical protein